MKNKKAVSTGFNMSFGLLPIALCMILSELMATNHALYICSVLGLAFSVGYHFLSRKGIRHFLLHASTVVLLLLSLATLLPIRIFPEGFLPLTLEIIVYMIAAFLFFRQKFIQGIACPKDASGSHRTVESSLSATTVTLKLVAIAGVVHLLAIAITLVFSNPLAPKASFILFHLLPPSLLIFTILINQFGIYYANRVFGQEEEIPIVNEQGGVIGKTYLAEIPAYKDLYTNPVVRIAFIHDGMLFLCKRDASHVVEEGKTDLPLETFLRFGEQVEDGARRLLRQAYPTEKGISPRFNIKHLFRNKETSRLVFLYIAYIEDETLLQNPFFKESKLWTFQQIEQNLGKGFFCQCFEEEYSYLKETVRIWEEFK